MLKSFPRVTRGILSNFKQKMPRPSCYSFKVVDYSSSTEAQLRLAPNRPCMTLVLLHYYPARMRKRSVCRSVFVIVRTICIYYRHLGTVGYNGDQIQQRNGLGLVWIRLIVVTGAKMVVGHAYQPRAFCPCARSTNLPDHAHRSV